MTAARRGLARVAPGPQVMAAELDGQWEVLAEAIQTVMRRYGLPEPYERLKELTRGHVISAEEVRAFVAGPGPARAAPRPACWRSPRRTYVGLAAELVRIGRDGPGALTCDASTEPSARR